MADATSAPQAKQGAAEPTLPGDAAKTTAPAGAESAMTGSGAPQGNIPGAHAEGKKETAPTEGDELVDEAIDGRGSAPKEAQAQDAAGNPVEKLTAERDLHDLDEDVHPDGRGREPKGYPEPEVHGMVNQDNVTDPGVQRTTEADGTESLHHGDERDYAAPADEVVEVEPDPGE
jgi:hypothetical protein